MRTKAARALQAPGDDTHKSCCSNCVLFGACILARLFCCALARKFSQDYENLTLEAMTRRRGRYWRPAQTFHSTARGDLRRLTTTHDDDKLWGRASGYDGRPQGKRTNERARATDLRARAPQLDSRSLLRCARASVNGQYEGERARATVRDSSWGQVVSSAPATSDRKLATLTH